MFVGHFEHSLDDKGRVVLPASVRQHLEDRCYVSQYDECLALWTPEEFKAVAARLTELVRTQQAPQGALRALAANAAEIKPDSQGRITIPERLRTFASLERDVMVVGAFNRAELWNADRWKAKQTEGDQSLTSAVLNLGI